MDGSLFPADNNSFFALYFTVTDAYCDSATHVAHAENSYPWVCDSISIVNTTSTYGTLELVGRYIDCRSNETPFTLSVAWGDNTSPVVGRKDANLKIDINNINLDELIVAANGFTYFKNNFTVTDTYCSLQSHVDDFVYSLNYSYSEGISPLSELLPTVKVM
jgi:hypothetical protein